MATRIASNLKKMQGRIKKRSSRRGLFAKWRERRKEKGTFALHARKRIAVDKLKLAVLYGVEAHARVNRKRPVVKDDPKSVPEEVDQDPAANADSVADAETTAVEVAQVGGGIDPKWLWGGAAAAVAVAAALVLGGRRGGEGNGDRRGAA